MYADFPSGSILSIFPIIPPPVIFAMAFKSLLESKSLKAWTYISVGVSKYSPKFSFPS